MIGQLHTGKQIAQGHTANGRLVTRMEVPHFVVGANKKQLSTLRFQLISTLRFQRTKLTS